MASIIFTSLYHFEWFHFCCYPRNTEIIDSFGTIPTTPKHILRIVIKHLYKRRLKQKFRI